MARYVKGDIVLSPFPFSGEEDFKVRPAVLLAVLPYAGGTDYLLCIITTQAAHDPLLRELHNSDIEGGRLSQDCYLRPTYAYTARKRSSSGDWAALSRRNFMLWYKRWSKR